MRSNPSKRSHEFLFEFHNEHGHKILGCMVLQNEVARLLKKGYITKLFSEKGKKYYMKNQSKEGPPGPHHPNGRSMSFLEDKNLME